MLLVNSPPSSEAKKLKSLRRPPLASLTRPYCIAAFYWVEEQQAPVCTSEKEAGIREGKVAPVSAHSSDGGHTWGRPGLREISQGEMPCLSCPSA